MSETKKILFRCDQNEFSGFGHFSRCLNLARHFAIGNKFKVSFLGNYSDFAIELLNKYEISYKNIEEKKFEKFETEIFSQHNYVLFDSYFIDQDYINKVSRLSSKSIFIDDTCELDFTDIDLVINFRIDADKMFSYSAKNQALGQEYFIYKPEFKAIRKNFVPKNKVEKLVLFFGGMNLFNTIYETISQLIYDIDSSIEVFVITNQKIKFKNSNVTILPLTFEIEKYLEDTDLIINGGGLIKYEGIFCKIPSATISSTQLQFDDTCILESKGILCNLGFMNKIGNTDLKKRLKELIETPKLRYEIFENSENIFSIDSINNIIKKINKI